MSIRLGVFLPPKKKAKIKLPDRILKLCREENVEVIDVLNLDELLEKGPFDVLLHKVTDLYNEMEADIADSLIEKIKDYCSKNESMKVIDNIIESAKLMDRIFQTKLMQSCEFFMDGIKIFVPKVVETLPDHTLEEVKTMLSVQDVKFPILAKPTAASLDEHSHDMKLVFTADYLCDLTFPCLIQEFCNHSGIVYKIFVVGDNHIVYQRPSVKDVHPLSKNTLYFDTRNVSKLGKSFIPDLHVEDPNTCSWISSDENPDLLNRNVVNVLCDRLRRLTNLYLFGIDILVEKATGNYALIDVNHFPGYSGMNENFFPQSLVKLIKRLGECQT